MGYDTKPNLDNSKFEQKSIDVLDLSGSTNILNSFAIESGGTFYIKLSGNTDDVLTRGLNGLSTWKTPNMYICGDNILTCMTCPSGLISTGNIFMGSCAGDNTINGEYNTALNSMALNHNISGSNNLAFGYRSMYLNTTGSNSVAFGSCAGFSNATGNSNIYIGKCAGFNELGSCKLHIGICSTESLICGDFSTKQLKICGDLSITNIMPRSGETNLIYYNQSNGKLSYASANASNISISPISPFTGTTVQALSDEYAGAISNTIIYASNGITKSDNTVVLGGMLTGDTTINLNSNNFSLTSGNFILSELSGTTGRLVEASSTGLITANKDIILGKISNSSVISLLTGSTNWTIFGQYVGLPITGTYEGQYYRDNSYYYFAYSDDNWSRVSLAQLTKEAISGLTSGSTPTFNGVYLTTMTGTTDRLVQANTNGFLSASTEIISGKITNATVISLLVDENNWDINGQYCGISITGTYEGQYYRDYNYFYFSYDDNDWTRMPRA